MQNSYEAYYKKYFLIIYNFILLSMTGCGLYNSFCKVYLYPYHKIMPIMIIIISIILSVLWSIRNLYTNIIILMSNITILLLVIYKNKLVRINIDNIILYIQRRADIYFNGNTSIDMTDGIKDVDRSFITGQIGILLILIVILTIIAIGLCRLQSVFLILLPVCAVMCIEMYHGRTPDLSSGICLFMGVIGMLYAIQLNINVDRRNIHFEKKETTGAVRKNLVFALSVSVCIFIVANITYYSRNKIMSYSTKALSMQHDIEKRAIDTAEIVWRKIQGKSTDGYMTNLRPLYTGKKIMKIVLPSKPEGNMYFKGFTGDNFDGRKWTTENNRDISVKNKQSYSNNYFSMINYMDRNVLSDCYQESDKMYMYYYKHFSDNSTLYVPYWSDVYNLWSLDNAVTQMLVNSDESQDCFKRSADIFGMDTFLSMTSQDNVREALEEAQYGIMYVNDDYDRYDDFFNFKYENDEFDNYVYEHYLSVPDELTKVHELAASIESDDNLFYQCKAVRDKIHELADYSLNLKGVPLNDNYLEYFLFEQHKGYCEHFATASTILMREKGVPARYASGYCVSPDEFKKEKIKDKYLDGEYYVAYVKDRDAHAWSEVYTKEYGWIPVDMTKGIDGFGAASDKDTTSKADEVKTADNHKDMPLSPTVNPVSQNDLNINNDVKPDDNKAVVFVKRSIRVILVILGIAALFYMINYILSVLIVNKYRKDIEKCTCINERLLVKTTYFIKVLKKCGFDDINKIDDEKYIDELRYKYGFDIDKEVIFQYEDILNRAEFSARQVSDEEDKICDYVMKTVVKNTWSMGGKLRRLSIYVLGLRKFIKGEYNV